MITRTSQMEDQLLLETSLSQLTARAERAFPDTKKRQHATDPISLIDLTLIPQRGSLLAKADVRGDSGKIYNTLIQFMKVRYNPPEGSPNVVFKAADEEYTITPISEHATDCKVRCTCLDFRFRFALNNFADQSLYGRKPKEYQPKRGSNRGPVNPTRAPGVCKHIIAVIDELRAAHLFE